MVEVKSYLSRVLVPIGDFRISPWNFDDGPHADTPAHYPRHVLANPISAPLCLITITCFPRCFEGMQYTTERRTRLVTTELIVSNCSALLSRDHTETLAHASSRTERRSFDKLTRTVNHDYSDGGRRRARELGHGDSRARPSLSEHARTRTSPSDLAQPHHETPSLSERAQDSLT